MHDVNGDVGVVVVEEVNDGENRIEVDEVRVELQCASEDLWLLKLFMEFCFGIGKVIWLVRVFKVSFNVLL